ncbi:MAG TPA: cytochrome c [Kofleriaceae bacterium]
MLAGCVANPAGDAAGGPKVFAMACARCHGDHGKPPEAMVQTIAVRDLTDPAFRKRVTAELVEKQVRKGSANKLMPAFDGALTDAQIIQVANWVSSDAFLSQK